MFEAGIDVLSVVGQNFKNGLDTSTEGVLLLETTHG